jgi:hypothetical protein
MVQDTKWQTSKGWRTEYRENLSDFRDKAKGSLLCVGAPKDDLGKCRWRFNTTCNTLNRAIPEAAPWNSRKEMDTFKQVRFKLKLELKSKMATVLTCLPLPPWYRVIGTCHCTWLLHGCWEFLVTTQTITPALPLQTAQTVAVMVVIMVDWKIHSSIFWCYINHPTFANK